jgi:hypothetical protein
MDVIWHQAIHICIRHGVYEMRIPGKKIAVVFIGPEKILGSISMVIDVVKFSGFHLVLVIS